MTRTEIIGKYAAPRWRLLLGSVLSVMYLPVLYLFYQTTTALWELISGAPVEPPVIGFMSTYGQASQNGYWVFVLATLALALVLIILPSRLGGGVGKWLAGVVYLTEDGYPTGIGHIAKKALILLGYFLVLAIPGPVLGFEIGPQADPVSLSLLALGLVFVGYMCWRTDRSGRTYAYRAAGIVPVLAHQRDAAAAALAATEPD
ncbi:MAG: hypothetical protein AAF674_03590 [Pseudomonadota bacterium]